MTSLTTGAIHNLHTALKKLDDDTSLRLKDTVRLSIVINMNKLLPYAQSYEQVRHRAYSELRAAGLNTDGVYTQDEAIFTNNFALRDLELRAVEHDVSLRMMTMDDFKPTAGGPKAESQHIPGLLWLRPVISDWPED